MKRPFFYSHSMQSEIEMCSHVECAQATTKICFFMPLKFGKLLQPGASGFLTDAQEELQWSES